MIFIKYNPKTLGIIEFPITVNQLKATLFKNTSLPTNHFYKKEVSLPDGYAQVFDIRNGEELNPTNSDTFFYDKVPKFVNGTWLLDAGDVALGKLLEEAKASKLQLLKVKTDIIFAEYTQSQIIPLCELDTWPMQNQEANDWAKDKKAATPILDEIALIRGIDPDTLKQKALEKSVAYKKVLAKIVGTRQKLEDDILAATTLDKLELITLDISI